MRPLPRLGPKVQWTEKQITIEKAVIKAELDQVSDLKGHKQRLRHALQQVKVLEEDDTPVGRLRLYIYIMSALVQHQRQPGLTMTQIDLLVAMAHALLQTQGIRPSVSKLSFLYGELHQARSLIHRRDGEQWLSAWEQQLAEFLSRNAPSGGAGFGALALGNRSLRLGNAAVAFHEFLAAEAAGLEDAQRFHALIGRMRALRLGGYPEHAARFANEIASDAAAPEAMRLEAQWEKLCADVTLTADLAPMTAAVRRGGSHYTGSYIVECYLWCAAAKKKEWVERLPKMRTLARNATIRPRRLGFYFEAALVLEDCYDTDIPLVIRLKKLGDIMARVKGFVNIDKEILVAAVAGRWLARIHSFPLAVLVLKEYEALCLRLSDGRVSDALGVAADLMEADWFRDRSWAELQGTFAPTRPRGGSVA